MNTISDEALYSATLAYWRFNGLLPELMPGPQKERTKNLVVSIIAAADAVRAREQSVTEREQAEQPEGITLDLDALAWASIKQAAAESNWIPHEHYTANDWTNDVCAFLRGDSEEQRTPQPSDSAVDEAVELLGEFQSVIGSRRPDDPDDGPYWDRISAAISALRTPSPAQVPEGWKLVPIEPTSAMKVAAFNTLEVPRPFDGHANGTAARNAVYRAMLAAAPTPPSAEQ